MKIFPEKWGMMVAVVKRKTYGGDPTAKLSILPPKRGLFHSYDQPPRDVYVRLMRIKILS